MYILCIFVEQKKSRKKKHGKRLGYVLRRRPEVSKKTVRFSGRMDSESCFFSVFTVVGGWFHLLCMVLDEFRKNKK